MAAATVRERTPSLYYKGGSDENCVPQVSSLFQDLRSSTSVSGEFFTDNHTFIKIHNHMKSSTSWKSVGQWDSSIEYTIRHPVGDIIVSDTNRGQRTVVYREHVLQTVRGSTGCKLIDFSIQKVRKEELDCTSRSYNDATYKWVKIKSEKIFAYESERSSWNFHLAVVWRGQTKALAENDERRYSITVSMGSVEKASRDAMYTTASFLEKMMDALFHKSKSPRHITLAL